MKRGLWTSNFLQAENYSAANMGYFIWKNEEGKNTEGRAKSLGKKFTDSRTDPF